MVLVCRAILSLFALVSSNVAVAETRDLYSEINVTGSVTVTIANPQKGPACANLWWIKRLTGGVRQLGQVCGTMTLQIPTFLGLSLASKLRASADRGTVITLVAREGIAKAISFNI